MCLCRLLPWPGGETGFLPARAPRETAWRRELQGPRCLGKVSSRRPLNKAGSSARARACRDDDPFWSRNDTLEQVYPEFVCVSYTKMTQIHRGCLSQVRRTQQGEALRCKQNAQTRIFCPVPTIRVLQSPFSSFPPAGEASASILVPLILGPCNGRSDNAASKAHQ